ncbi:MULTISPECIES: phosphate acyltransferase PlsX [Bosea]|uniref:phosphate acyltransferase PlsX n=1 Tax=Bosea TaxID=85413 RepID=UPI00214FAF6A|nr:MULTISPECIES: phosphate acyltransferase PlsX [Bosea]MCR4520448.1 phosphate acyltransferase PlsX [Bosea sp. 47.2.35]MDR6827800.1 glycerol-3-phosphate acyltransferase PlsX [Bosea robiniae]MDR6894506.1 glycerol-3-phosphate acyltransferase PlsX [Bosea sp. BE109]MDR7137906.1 glycerol-3-phosphate acyltransferase PlsX [Bosea sp. BE168]MDR7174605.1 glycerol-3-phosphate acyltransferase PlsX [Bosea sp. BE271]
MTRPVTIALDAMGGDHGPSVVIPGAALMLERRPDARFVIFGDEKQVLPLIDQHPKLKAVTTFHHTEVSVKMDDKPSQALRYGRYKSSMWRAIDATKTGEADVTVSAGNTGALMAMSKFCLKSMPQVDRPALAGLWPTARGESIVLDLGATIGADARHLVDLAVMGAAMARVVLDLDRPTVGLLNVGVEEIKGVEAVKEAGRILRESDLPHLSYHGFVEGDDLGKGTVDVVVTEGFTGNIALKTAEGTAKQIAEYLRAAMGRSLMSKIGYLFARGAFTALKEKLDPRKSNGGVFLGLEGIVVKSHGGTDVIGFASAAELGYEMAREDLMAKVREMVAASTRPELPAAQPAETE